MDQELHRFEQEHTLTPYAALLWMNFAAASAYPPLIGIFRERGKSRISSFIRKLRIWGFESPRLARAWITVGNGGLEKSGATLGISLKVWKQVLVSRGDAKTRNFSFLDSKEKRKKNTTKITATRHHTCPLLRHD